MRIVLVVAWLLICQPTVFAALTVEVSGTDEVVKDDVTNLYWYRKVADFTNLDYAAQLSAIAALNAPIPYFGISNWHLATRLEMDTLIPTTGVIVELISKFPPTSTSDQTVAARYEETKNEQPAHFYTAHDAVTGRVHFPGGVTAIADNTPEENTGAWAVGILNPPNQPPVAVCQDVTVSAGENCTADASIDNGSSDPDDDAITLSQSPAGPYPLGETEVTLTVSDGELSDTCTAKVTVVDNTKPVITVTGDIIELWPPNHQYVTIYVSDCIDAVSDNCNTDLSVDDVVITEVSSDEEEDAKGGGDGKTRDDIVIDSGCQSVQLRAERQGKGNGRVYTIHYSVDDGNGNTSETVTCLITVPKSQNGDVAVDDGPVYTVSCGD